jgi:hypothetical protein
MLSPRQFTLMLAAGIMATGVAQASSDPLTSLVAIQSLPIASLPVETVEMSPLTDTESKQSAETALSDAMAHASTSTASNSLCFTMRSYKFRQRDAGRDDLQPAGESTCESSSLFSLKNAVESK